MNRVVTILLISIITFCSCKNDNLPEKPENLISEDKMVHILIDLSILSSAKGLNKKILENNGITPDEYVYQKHNIDSVQFSESNTFYSYFMDDYSNIYSRVKDSLEKLKLKYSKLEQAESEKKKADKANKQRDLTKDSVRIPKKDKLLTPPPIEDEY
ncbi:DUF4296 domain-containing protein [Hanstruepera ponticola]|uniref:DUF4296 domain-containing protein n=1 Tax=Hanstruepera ponticola TaxID=2042995 RepID=UPI000CF06943|nr:DUF4296 domain-containing protein [Hanstruepera ponticola]